MMLDFQIPTLSNHNIFVGLSIVNNQEYLYYFIGDCDNAQQDTFYNNAILRFHQVEDVCVTLPTSLLAYMVKNTSVERHYTQKELLSHLNALDVEMLI
ncbi:hypothetical protein IW261DRAFT_1574833 [Armillaria novae-zelandiae]|uniref:Uncharacterized protein n=1 Tax=Armillaria novae-zelandiae TaxID=153914 RepID=A0AA39NHK2_9AGAR|nr:hypothetical protein IW261DRAFT_1574833 [Armillaria novae-zelandiae]